MDRYYARNATELTDCLMRELDFMIMLEGRLLEPAERFVDSYWDGDLEMGQS